MSSPAWLRSLTRALSVRSSSSRSARRRMAPFKRVPSTVPKVECLEDRVTPTVVDLSTAPGLSDSINGAIFTGATGHNNSGTGNFDPFLRVSSNQTIEQGFNTDASPKPLDDDNSHVHSVPLTALQTVKKGGTTYVEFALDINQNNTPGDALLSLDELRLYLSPSNTLNSYDPSTG